MVFLQSLVEIRLGGIILLRRIILLAQFARSEAAQEEWKDKNTPAVQAYREVSLGVCPFVQL